MDIIYGYDYKMTDTAVTLGKFDALHKGHRYLLSNILKRDGLTSVVYTFSYNTGQGRHIYTQKEKDEILERLGIEKEIVVPFDEYTKNMLPEQFIRDILVEKTGAKYICVGEDFRFGKDRSGDVSILREYAKKYGYELDIIKKLSYGKGKISSTAIKQMLDNGEVSEAKECLGDNYFIKGKVVRGNRLGNKLGFPTANIVPEEIKYLPEAGVYDTFVIYGENRYDAITNVGNNPTVDGKEFRVETHITGFDKDLYGKEIVVMFRRFIRKEKRFEGLDALKQQIAKDINKMSREYSE